MFTVIITVYLFTVFILTLPVLFICYIIRKKDFNKSRTFAVNVARIWAKGCLLLGGVRVNVIGKENIPKDAVLFVGNHRSLYDIPVFYAKTPKEVGFVAKLEMKKIPIMRLWMENVGCLFLDRKDIRAGLKTILQGIEYIKNGGSLFICPEGTRSHNDVMGEFKEGSLKLAEKSGCPIIPVAFIGTDNRFEKNKLGVKPGKCSLAFGEPIYVKELDSNDKKFLGQYVRKQIQKLIDDNK